MRCRRCGAELSPLSTLCPRCGAERKHWRRGRMVCRSCGQRVPAQGTICPACGKPLQRSWRWVGQTLLVLLVAGAVYYGVVHVITLPRIERQVQALLHPDLSFLLPTTPTPLVVPTRVTPTRPEPTRIPTATP